MFFLKKIISLLLLPPVGPVLVTMFGLSWLQRRPVMGRAIAWLGVGLFWLVSTPLTVGMAVHAWESGVPNLTPEAAQHAQAIVILGGGRTFLAKEYGGYAPNRLSLERARYGVHLYRQYGHPILVTGGAIPKIGPSEAALMKEALEMDFAVPVRWLETEARDSKENAIHSARILLPLGIKKVLLVSHAAHLPRALEEFRRAGFEPIAAPTGYFAGEMDGIPTYLASYLPSASALFAGWYVSHEFLGQLAQRWF